jgi:hypothetical protein
MTSLTLDAAGAGLGTSVVIDTCAPCTLFWFDYMESVRLSPKAVLELFRLIGATGAARNAVKSSTQCPRCSHALAFTHDLQRTTRFTYWRCPEGHGRLVTFGQFLAEKNFVRPPSPDELARLRDAVRQVSCSQCGAPVDLRAESVCPHCGAPVTLIDPASVSDALQALARDAAAQPSPEHMTERIRDAQIDALFELARSQAAPQRNDLLAAGAAAVGAFLGKLLAA